MADGRGQIALADPGAPGNEDILPLFDKIAVTKALYLVLVQLSGRPVIHRLHNGSVPKARRSGQAFYPAVVTVVPLALHEVGNDLVIGIVGLRSVGAQGRFKCPVHAMEPELLHLLYCPFVHMWYLSVLIHNIFRPVCSGARAFPDFHRCPHQACPSLFLGYARPCCNCTHRIRLPSCRHCQDGPCHIFWQGAVRQDRIYRIVRDAASCPIWP